MPSLADKEYVVFDLDNTTCRIDTFVWFLVRLFVRHPRVWLSVPALSVAFVAHKMGLKDNSWLKEFYLKKVVVPIDPDRLEIVVNEFVESLVEKKVYPRAKCLISDAKQQGKTVVLATASPDIYVIPFAEKMGFDEVVCTNLEHSVDGRLTGNLQGNNCYGEEKRRLVEKRLSDGKVALVYSDSLVDLPLLLLADKAVVINPSGSFFEKARSYGFQVEAWK